MTSLAFCRQDFANLAEAIVKGSDRRTDLNKAYSKLVRVLFEQIQRVAAEHQKTPREVILMGMFSLLFYVLEIGPVIQCSQRNVFFFFFTSILFLSQL